MENLSRKINLIPVFLLTLLLLTQNGFAMSPEGHPESLDKELQDTIVQRLDDEGYMAAFSNGQDISRGISSYLWDNRHWLASTDFSKPRQVDALVCLMMKKGYSEFDKYGEDINDWCSQIIKIPAPDHH